MLHVILLLDESLSTQKFKDIYVQTLNNFIGTQKIKYPDAFFTLMAFSKNTRILCNRQPFRVMPIFDPKQYRPGSTTSMYDAILTAIDNSEQKPEDRNAVIIITDGHDNSSVTTGTVVHNRILGLSNYWKFFYVGVEKEEGKRLGIQDFAVYNQSHTSIAKVVNCCNMFLDKCIREWSTKQTTGMMNDDEDALREESKPLDLDVRDLISGMAGMGF